MSGNVYCPVCGVKLCETTKSEGLKVRCKKCKSEMSIDKDEMHLQINALGRREDAACKSTE